MTDLSIVIVSFNTKELTLGAINSVIKHAKGITYEILVIDNASEDGSVEALKKLASGIKNVKLVFNKDNLGFGGGNNQGMKLAKSRFILLLNSDTRIDDSNVLGEMVNWMDKNPKVGVASCSLKYQGGKIQATGGYFPTLMRVFAWMTFIDDLPGFSSIIKPFHPMHDLSPLGANTAFYNRSQSMDWVTGAFFMMRSEMVREVGYFDRDYFMYMEEVDYCFRAKNMGWEVKYLPGWSITHFGGGSTNPEFSLLSEMKGLKIFYKKHMPAWKSPLLSFLLKLGAFLRIFVFGKKYAKIFVSA